MRVFAIAKKIVSLKNQTFLIRTLLVDNSIRLKIDVKLQQCQDEWLLEFRVNKCIRSPLEELI